ncbi:GNAT family N-acetyltransferase [Yinghuangia aomiensis]
MADVELDAAEDRGEVARWMARGPARSGAGVRAAWVAERRRREAVGLVAAAPPLRWIGTVPGLGPDHRTWIAERVVELEVLSVAPAARGRRLGHTLVETAAAHFTALGYRLMMGTLAADTGFLAPYYERGRVHRPGAR